jgi:hypothetical protein
MWLRRVLRSCSSSRSSGGVTPRPEDVPMEHARRGAGRWAVLRSVFVDVVAVLVVPMAVVQVVDVIAARNGLAAVAVGVSYLVLSVEFALRVALFAVEVIEVVVVQDRLTPVVGQVQPQRANRRPASGHAGGGTTTLAREPAPLQRDGTDTVSHRYAKLAKRLGIDTFHDRPARPRCRGRGRSAGAGKSWRPSLPTSRRRRWRWSARH